MISKIPSWITANFCYWIDRSCRHDLNIGRIVNERDYVSTLGTHLRYPFGPLVSFELAIAQTLPARQETIFGCDSILIFKKGQSANSTNFGNLIFNILRCSYGRLFPIADYQVTLLNDDNETIQVPIVRTVENRNGNATILSFMEKSGLMNFIQLEIIDFGKEE